MAVFFFIPAGASLFYAFTNARGDFVWFANFSDVLTNMAFRLAARNSLLFLAASVPLNVVISFLLASLLQNLRHKKVLIVAFMLPLIIPSGSVVFFWNTLFADNGAINSILFRAGLDTVPWFSTNWSFSIILMVFLLRNIGFNLVLYLAGFQLIPKDYYEVARIEGAGIFASFRHVTFMYILPTSFLVFMMSIINSFRVFREIYLLFGPYPHQSVYMLQHFMNNQFLFANMQRLSVTAMILSGAVIILVWGVFSGQRKISESFG
jgi:multiple sugar transport system permease protein